MLARSVQTEHFQICNFDLSGGLGVVVQYVENYFMSPEETLSAVWFGIGMVSAHLVKYTCSPALHGGSSCCLVRGVP